MTFTEGMDDIAKVFEVVGAAVLVVVLLLAFTMSGRVWWRTRHGRVAYQTLRETFGGVLLLGLEILVAADLVRTVAVEPTLENVAILGLGTIEKRPVVVDDAIAIRSMVYLTLSYDHRVVDGAIAHQFMGKVKHTLENWTESIL